MVSVGWTTHGGKTGGKGQTTFFGNSQGSVSEYWNRIERIWAENGWSEMTPSLNWKQNHKCHTHFTHCTQAEVGYSKTLNPVCLMHRVSTTWYSLVPYTRTQWKTSTGSGVTGPKWIDTNCSTETAATIDWIHESSPTRWRHPLKYPTQQDVTRESRVQVLHFCEEKKWLYFLNAVFWRRCSIFLIT